MSAPETPAKPTDRKSSVNALLKTLAAAFPVFKNSQPLAIGVHKVVAERMPEINAGTLRLAMKLHTRTNRYLKALATSDKRFDLDGNPAGEITAEQRAQAAEELRARLRRDAEKRREQLQEQEHKAKLAKLVEKFSHR